MEEPQTKRVLVRPGMYRDSVELMRVSAALESLPGVSSAAALMATPANLSLLRDAGLVDEHLATSSSDLVIAVAGSPEAVEAALAHAETLLQGTVASTESASSAGHTRSGRPPTTSRA